MIAVMAFVAYACQKEQKRDSDVVKISIMVNIPDDAARKAGDAELADKVYYEVWNEDYSRLAVSGTADIDAHTASIDLQLVRDRLYNIILWAQSSSCTAYSWDNLKEINVSYKEDGEEYAAGNREERDAFFAVSQIKTHNIVSKYISLTRPFTQLNIYADDLAGYEFKGSEIRIKGLSTVFDTIAGEGKTGNHEVSTFSADALFTTDKVIEDGVGYDYVAMNYLLIPGTSSSIEINATFNAVKDGNDISSSREIKNVTVKMNERVNVFGSIMK